MTRWPDLSTTFRNGLRKLDQSMRRWTEPVARPGQQKLGRVPITGHGGISADQLSSAVATLAVRPELPTVADLESELDRFGAFVEGAAFDVSVRNLGRSYWQMQGATVDADDEIFHLASEMERLQRLEGAGLMGWLIRNAAVRAQRPIAMLTRSADDAGEDALALADTLLGSARRLDPTDGGFLFSPRPRRDRRWRSRGRFGDLWIYGD